MALTSVSDKTLNEAEEEPIQQRGSPRNNHAQSMNLLSDGIPNAFSSSDTTFVTMSEHTEGISAAIPNSNTESISDHFHRCTLLQEGGLWQWLCEAVSEHLSSRYIAQVHLSISSHIGCMIVLGCNVCNCSSAVDSVLDARDQ
jgi:hypothetical protein